MVSKGPEFRKYLDSLERIPDVICLQETFFKDTTIVSFPGYTVLRKDRDDGYGGVAILIRKEISYSKFVSIDDIEGVSVTIGTVSGPLEVINIYCPPNAVFDEATFADIFQRQNALICGDFNAKSTLWGSPKRDHRGKVIEGILDNCDKVVLNTGLSTRFYQGGVSHLDLTFISPGFANIWPSGKCWNILVEVIII
jgi:hypothetical protein